MARNYGKVAVLMGGPSAEREVSIKSGTAVLSALRRQGVDAHAVDPDHDIVQTLTREKFDRAFIVLHGRWGEDGVIQGALETIGMAYTGCGVLASALGMDKLRCKLLWSGAGIPVPPYVVLTRHSDFDAVARTLGLPMFVKPVREGSSFGITRVTRAGDLAAAYETAARYDDQVLAEQAIVGPELTCAVLGDEALPVIRIETVTEFYDYEAKYVRDDTRYLCPAGIPEPLERQVRALALDVFRSIDGRGWGRVDFMVDASGQPYVLEVNTVPGMTDHSLVPKAAKAAGIDFDALVMRILETSCL